MLDNIYVFCYLDILGYRDIVHTYADDSEAILKLEEFLNDSIFRMYDGFRNIRTGIKGDIETREILDSIKISLISDSILVRMPLKIGVNEKEKKDCTVAIQAYLYFTSFLIITFINNIGLFLRGGISVGQHYENILKQDSLFMFSKSLIQAYLHEQKAETIRILIDPALVSFLANNNKDFSLEQHKENFYEDTDGELCLDYYDVLSSTEMRNRFLKNVLEIVEINITRHKENKYILSKYEAFAKYHNDIVLNRFMLPVYEMNLAELTR